MNRDPGYIFIRLHFQMKQEHIKVMTKAMSYIIKHLDVDVSFLSEFESQNILDEHSIEEILVGKISKRLQVVINSGLMSNYVHIFIMMNL